MALQSYDPDSQWFWSLPDETRERAEERLAAIYLVERIERMGHNRSAAVIMASGRIGVHHRTLWTWLGHVQGIERHPVKWLMALVNVPRK